MTPSEFGVYHDEGARLLECYNVSDGKYTATFLSGALPSYSGYKNKNCWVLNTEAGFFSETSVNLSVETS
jgi:hypothetical protein